MIRLSRFPVVFSGILAVLSFSDTLRAQPSIQVSPQIVNFTVPVNTPTAAGCNGNAECKVHITGTNVGTIQVSNPTPWIQISPSVLNLPGDLNIAVNTVGLNPGTLSSTFTVFSSSNPMITQTVTVNLTVTSGTSQLAASPTSLTFNGQADQTFGTPQGCPIQNSPASCQITITTTSAQPLNYNIIVTPDPLHDPHPWLIPDRLSGTTNGSPVNIAVNPSLTAGPGVYTGSLVFQSTTTNDSVTVAVTLNVTGTPTLSVAPSQLNFFYTTGTATPPAQQFAISSTSGTVGFNITISPNAPWLGVTPISGSVTQGTPQPVTVNLLPASLATLQPGSYPAQITINPSAGGAAQVVNVTLVVSHNPFLTAPTTPLTFSASFGGSTPSSQNVVVGSTGGALSFSATASSDQNWLTVTPTSGTTGTGTGTLAIGVNPLVLPTLGVGVYKGTVTITPTNGDPYSIQIPATLTVGTTSQLTVAPQQLFFSFQTGQAPPAAQTIVLQASGPPVGFSVTTAINAANPPSCGTGTWLSATPQTSPFTTPNLLTVSVNTSGMTAGAPCQGTVKITYASGQGNAEVDVPVTLFVSSTPLLNISLPQGFGMEATTIGGATINRTIAMSSTDGTTAIQYQVSFQSSPCAWLFAAPATGGSAGTTPTSVQVTILPGCIGAPGTYQGSVSITSTSLPQAVTFSITLQVTSNVQIAVTPQALSFTQSQNGPLPEPQKLNFTVSGGNAPFIATATADLGNWLKVDPTTGNTSAGFVTVSILSNTLPPSVTPYTGRVVITFQNAATPSATIPVTLKVNPPQTVSVTPQSLSFTYQLTGPTPPAQTLNVSSTGGAVNFTIGTTSTGGWLLSDTTNGQTGANGQPKAVSISIDPTKIPAGTVAGAQLQGSITVSAPTVLSTPIAVPVTLSITAAPVPSPVTISNSADTTNGFGAIVPGEQITIKGTNLGPTTAVIFKINAQGKVDSTLGGVQVLFDGIPGTPTYVSATQINVIVPWEIAGRTTTNMVVSYNNGQSQPFSLQVAQAAPRIYTQNGNGLGQAAAINLSPSAASVYNGPAGQTYPGTTLPLAPAAQGSFVGFFLTGGGQTNPASTTGSINSATQLMPLLNWTEGSNIVTATVGGVPAHVQFAGAAPTLINGTVQVNLQIPAGVSGNNLPVVITINGQQTQATATIAVQ